MARDIQGLRSLLIPTRRESILVPSAVVAEVIGYKKPESIEGVPDWITGFINWREYDLPVILLDDNNDEGQAEVGLRARIIVFYSLNQDSAIPYYGVLASGIPRAFLASRENVQTSADKQEHRNFVLESVSLSPEGQAFIPDLDGIHTALIAEIT